jgi:hypothetical protein
MVDIPRGFGLLPRRLPPTVPAEDVEYDEEDRRLITQPLRSLATEYPRTVAPKGGFGPPGGHRWGQLPQPPKRTPPTPRTSHA